MTTDRRRPTVTADQMREVDRVMVEDLHIGLIQMMENAGRGLADVATSVFAPKRVVVLAGSGGNGGGGLTAARHLANRGVGVTVVLARPGAQMTAVPAQQLDILRRMGVPVLAGDGPQWVSTVARVAPDLVIDAVVGYGLSGPLADTAATLVEWARRQPAPVLALDVPSGVDATTGTPGPVHIHAAVTATLALPKTGLRCADVVGRLFLVDLSVPPSAYREIGLTVDPLPAPLTEIELSEDSLAWNVVALTVARPADTSR